MQIPCYTGLFENYKGPGTSFQATSFIEFFDKKIYFVMLYKFHWPNFITGLCLLPKLFNKMYFMFYAWAFDDVMTFKYLKI